jgi:hypothetical protein
MVLMVNINEAKKIKNTLLSRKIGMKYRFTPAFLTSIPSIRLEYF